MRKQLLTKYSAKAPSLFMIPASCRAAHLCWLPLWPTRNAKHHPKKKKKTHLSLLRQVQQRHPRQSTQCQQGRHVSPTTWSPIWRLPFLATASPSATISPAHSCPSSKPKKSQPTRSRQQLWGMRTWDDGVFGLALSPSAGRGKGRKGGRPP